MERFVDIRWTVRLFVRSFSLCILNGSKRPIVAIVNARGKFHEKFSFVCIISIASISIFSCAIFSQSTWMWQMKNAHEQMWRCFAKRNLDISNAFIRIKSCRRKKSEQWLLRRLKANYILWNGCPVSFIW